MRPPVIELHRLTARPSPFPGTLQGKSKKKVAHSKHHPQTAQTSHVIRQRHGTARESLLDRSTEGCLSGLRTALHCWFPEQEGWSLHRSHRARQGQTRDAGAKRPRAPQLKTMTAKKETVRVPSLPSHVLLPCIPSRYPSQKRRAVCSLGQMYVYIWFKTPKCCSISRLAALLCRSLPVDEVEHSNQVVLGIAKFLLDACH